MRCQVTGISFLILCLLFAGYANGQVIAKGKITGYDDFGRKIILPKAPERIVIISASSIDAIFELKAGNKIVGVTDAIDRSYPETVRRYPSLLKKPRVGGFSNPNIEKIISLEPDLIIVYDSLDNPGKYTEVFEKRGLPYAAFITVKNLAFGMEQIRRLGVLLDKGKEAETLTKRIKTEVKKLTLMISSSIKNRPLVYYWWGSGNGTYGNQAAINELIEIAGGINLAGEFDKQYMELSPEYVISKNPDVIVISYWQEDQREARVKEIKSRPGFNQVEAVKNNCVYTIDGHSLHTSLLFAEAIRNLAGFIHPELFITTKAQRCGK
jgi:iron complex transport system substrate-binding protein